MQKGQVKSDSDSGLFFSSANPNRGGNVVEIASMVKLKMGRLSRQVADGCLQYWGGMGFTSETRISRLYRDCRVGSIGGGSDETMLAIICKLMGTLPKGSGGL